MNNGNEKQSDLLLESLEKLGGLASSKKEWEKIETLKDPLLSFVDFVKKLREEGKIFESTRVFLEKAIEDFSELFWVLGLSPKRIDPAGFNEEEEWAAFESLNKPARVSFFKVFTENGELKEVENAVFKEDGWFLTRIFHNLFLKGLGVVLSSDCEVEVIVSWVLKRMGKESIENIVDRVSHVLLKRTRSHEYLSAKSREEEEALDDDSISDNILKLINENELLKEKEGNDFTDSSEVFFNGRLKSLLKKVICFIIEFKDKKKWDSFKNDVLLPIDDLVERIGKLVDESNDSKNSSYYLSYKILFQMFLVGGESQKQDISTLLSKTVDSFFKSAQENFEKKAETSIEKKMVEQVIETKEKEEEQRKLTFSTKSSHNLEHVDPNGGLTSPTYK